jgi:hypothetical protein
MALSPNPKSLKKVVEPLPRGRNIPRIVTRTAMGQRKKEADTKRMAKNRAIMVNIKRVMSTENEAKPKAIWRKEAGCANQQTYTLSDFSTQGALAWGVLFYSRDLNSAVSDSRV